MSLPSDATADVTEALERTGLPSRPTIRRSPADQRGWAVAMFVAFLGIAVIGPAWTRLVDPKRPFKKRIDRGARTVRDKALEARTTARKRLRRLGGGSFTR